MSDKCLFDRDHIGSRGSLFQKPNDHVKGLVMVTQQHVLLPDRGKHVVVMV